MIFNCCFSKHFLIIIYYYILLIILFQCEFSEVKELWRNVLNEVPDFKESKRTVKPKYDLKHPLIVVEGMDGSGIAVFCIECSLSLSLS